MKALDRTWNEAFAAGFADGRAKRVVNEALPRGARRAFPARARSVGWNRTATARRNCGDGDAELRRARQAAILGPMPTSVFHVQVPAEATCLRAVRAFVGSVLEEHCGIDTANLVLALDEACANVVRHRVPVPGHDDIDVRIELGGGTVRFRIGCFCARRDMPRIRPRDPADERPGGFGTLLIGQIMDRVDFEPDPAMPGRMVLVLEKRLGGARP